MAKATVTEKVTTTKTYHLELTEVEATDLRDELGAGTGGGSVYQVFLALRKALPEPF